jgi:DNA topoisomerase IA
MSNFKLVVCEKPSVAMAVSKVLGANSRRLYRGKRIYCIVLCRAFSRTCRAGGIRGKIRRKAVESREFADYSERVEV